MREVIDQELLLNQIIAQTVSAGRLLNEKKEKTTTLLFPKSWAFFLESFFALGCLTLDKERPALLIFEDREHSDQISFFDKEISSYLGMKRTILEKRKEKAESFGRKKTEQEPHDMLKRLAFLHVISNIHQGMILFVGREAKIDSLRNWIKEKSMEEASLLFFSDFSENLPIEEAVEKDQLLFESLTQERLSEDEKRDFPQIFLFLEALKRKNQKAEILSYFNSGELGMNHEITTSYGVILGRTK